MDLFIQPNLKFEKVAAETDLPEDPNSWPQEVLQELYKQVPYIADFDPHVNMQRVDAERAFGLGAVEVANQSEMQRGTPPDAAEAAGIRNVRIPVVIKDGKLQPFDLLVKDDSTVVPLTEARLRQALFRPQQFDVTSGTPGDQSMIAQLYPPYRQNYGFGGGGVAMNVGGMGKGASALEDFLEKEASAGRAKKVLQRGKELITGSKVKKLQDAAKKHDDLSAIRDMPGSKMHRYRRSVDGNKVNQKMEYTSPHGRSKSTSEGRFPDNTQARESFKAPFRNEFARAGRHGKAADKLQGAAKKEKSKVTATRVGTGAAAATGLGGIALNKKKSEMAKKGSILEAILPTINASDRMGFIEALQDPHLQASFTKNAAATYASLDLILNYEPSDLSKEAQSLFGVVRPNVVQVTRVDEGYRVKKANASFWSPTTETMHRGDIIRRFGEKIALAADLNGSVTMADTDGVQEEEAPADEEGQEAGPITENGLYKVWTSDDRELVGFVFNDLYDVDGTLVPLSLFTNGSESAVQADIIGTKAGEAFDCPTADEPSGFGSFVSPEGEATVPLELGGSYSGPDANEPAVLQGQSFDGRGVEVSVQPNIQVVMGTEDGKMLVPAHWKWMPLENSKMVDLHSAEEEVGKEAAAQRSFASVQIRSSGEDSFSISGPAVEKVAHAEREFVDVDDAMFLLAGLGVNQQYGVKKLAEAYAGTMLNRKPVTVRIGRIIKTAADQTKEASALADDVMTKLPAFRKNLFKEASVIPDPMAVDTVLSLGFLNPENITTFISYLPVIEDAQQKLSELLFASRCGMEEIPTSALERSVRSVEEVLEGLKVLAFQQS